MTTTSTTEDIIQRTLNYTTKFITTTLTTKGDEKDHHISRLGWLKWLVNRYLYNDVDEINNTQGHFLLEPG